MTIRNELRTATREAHERVDAAFGAHDLGDVHAYGQFLIGHAAALLPVEAALDRAGAPRLIEQWEAHRRAPLLLADLAALGLAPPQPIDPPAYADDAELVGGLYVLEGSRLGGAVLRKRVAAGLPSAFLSARQEPGRWTRFIASLERLLYSPQRLDAAIGAAIDTFAHFERAARFKQAGQGRERREQGLA